MYPSNNYQRIANSTVTGFTHQIEIWHKNYRKPNNLLCAFIFYSFPFSSLIPYIMILSYQTSPKWVNIYQMACILMVPWDSVRWPSTNRLWVQVAYGTTVDCIWWDCIILCLTKRKKKSQHFVLRLCTQKGNNISIPMKRTRDQSTKNHHYTKKLQISRHFSVDNSESIEPWTYYQTQRGEVILCKGIFRLNSRIDAPHDHHLKNLGLLNMLVY